VDSVALGETLRLARAAERLGCLTPSDWPDVAVALLLEGVEDAEVAELAGLDRQVSGWTVDPLTTVLYERHAVPNLAADSAVRALAGLMAADLLARPAAVTGPMIRILAQLAQPSDFEASLANECYGVEEYLDCDCSGRLDPAFEAELEAIPGPHIPDALVQVLAAPLRATLPLIQPPHGH
jgi:hypothetical protein